LAAALFVAVSFGLAGIAEARPPQVGEPAEDFSLRDTAGQEVRLSSLRGRPVLLTFWATWCEPCKVEMPEIQKAYDQHKTDGFVVLAVNFGEKAEKAKAYADKSGMSFPVLVDRRANVASQYTVVSLPVSFFIDPDGVIRERVFGGTLTVDRIGQILQRLTAAARQ
jgi:peroxiredoxin